MNPLDEDEARSRVDDVEAVFAKRAAATCSARPWRSCSRPDGTPLNYYWRANGRGDTRGLSGTSCEVMP